jgi:hypothetical protein
MASTFSRLGCASVSENVVGDSFADADDSVMFMVSTWSHRYIVSAQSYFRTSQRLVVVRLRAVIAVSDIALSETLVTVRGKQQLRQGLKQALLELGHIPCDSQVMLSQGARLHD